MQIGSVGLSKNLLRALNASSVDLPDLSAFPKSHIVTFQYYVGVIHFLDENYAQVRTISSLVILKEANSCGYLQAEEHLAEAWRLCHRHALKNKESVMHDVSAGLY